MRGRSTSNTCPLATKALSDAKIELDATLACPARAAPPSSQRVSSTNSIMSLARLKIVWPLSVMELRSPALALESEPLQLASAVERARDVEASLSLPAVQKMGGSVQREKRCGRPASAE